MTTAVLKTLAIAATLLLFGSFGSSAWGQEASYSLKLDQLKADGVNATSIRAAYSVKFSGSSVQSGMINHDVDLAYLQFKAHSDRLQVGQRLDLRFDHTQDVPVSGYACSPDQSCDPLDVSPKGKDWVIASNTASWTLRLFGSSVCRDGLKFCRLEIPSWALSRQHHTASPLQILPETMTIIKTAKQLMLVEPVRGRVVQTYDLNTPWLGALGELRGAQVVETNWLQLQFTAGVLTLDFAADQAWVAKDDGLWQADQGLGALDQASLTARLPRSPDSDGALLGMFGRYVLWQNSLSFLQPATSGWQPAAAQQLSSASVAARQGDHLLVYTNDRRIWRVDSTAQDAIQPIKQLPEFGSLQDAHLRFLGEAIAKVTSKKVTLLGGASEQATSLQFGERRYYILNQGHVLVQKSTDDSCQWQHLRQSATNAAAFIETGFTVDCGLLEGFSADDDHVIATIHTGATVEIYQLQQQPSGR